MIKLIKISFLHQNTIDYINVVTCGQNGDFSLKSTEAY